MTTYTIKYLRHIYPEINGNKGKHWSVLKNDEIGKKDWNKAEFSTIDEALETFKQFKETHEKSFPNIPIIKVKVMSGKEVTKEIEF